MVFMRPFDKVLYSTRQSRDMPIKIKNIKKTDIYMIELSFIDIEHRYLQSSSALLAVNRCVLYSCV